MEKLCTSSVRNSFHQVCSQLTDWKVKLVNAFGEQEN
jgi:hypothetical protein